VVCLLIFRRSGSETSGHRVDTIAKAKQLNQAFLEKGEDNHGGEPGIDYQMTVANGNAQTYQSA
jgi:hypothetical protein